MGAINGILMGVYAVVLSGGPVKVPVYGFPRIQRVKSKVIH